MRCAGVDDRERGGDGPISFSSPSRMRRGHPKQDISPTMDPRIREDDETTPEGNPDARPYNETDERRN
jgi:hypothetical protein